MEDIGVYVACVDAACVPDHWRSKSPLGRDFSSMPRHRMLAFQSGADAGKQWVTLTLPETLEFRLDESPPWTIQVGIAWRIGDRFYRIASADLTDFSPGDGHRIEATIVAAGSSPQIRVKRMDAERPQPTP